MKPSTYRMLFLLSAVLLMVGQLSMAQQSALPGTPNQTAVLAAAIGQPLPLVPASAVPQGLNRPHIWVAAFLGAGGAAPLYTLPSFCNNTSSGRLVYCPNAIQTAYGISQIISGNGGAGMTIAIVDAYYYANAAADFNKFNTDMGLPACTAASGCFTQVHYTATPNSGWEIETMLDIEYAHAMAPNAKILLVEAASNSFADLITAETYAAGHADIVSNSWGASEFPSELSYDYFFALGKPLLFSSGDKGAPTEYPCSSINTTCVGGTTLTLLTTFQRDKETGWSGSGGGYSAYELQPGYQATILPKQTYRATPDVAADADPNTGVAVYDSGNGGYFAVGGTSLSCPLTAGLFADITTARVSFGQAKFTSLNNSLYRAAKSNYSYFFFDVLTGNNGFAAGPGFDRVTGLGVSTAAAMANRFFGLILP